MMISRPMVMSLKNRVESVRDVFSSLAKDRHVWVLIVLVTLYLAVFGSATVGGAGLDQYLILRSIVEDGDINLSNQRFYSESAGGKMIGVSGYSPVTQRFVTRHSFGTAMLTLPFYLASLIFDDFIHYRDPEFLDLQGDVFAHSLFFALGIALYSFFTLLMIYKFSSRITSAKVGFYTALLAFFATPFGYYSNCMYHPEHALETFCLTLAIFIWDYQRQKDDPLLDCLLGAILGLAFTVKYVDAVLLIPFAAWYLFKKRTKRLALVITSFIPFALLVFLYWQIQYGDYIYGITHFGGYGQAYYTYFPKYILTLLFDYRKMGLFTFHPALLLSLPGFYFLWKRDRDLCFISFGVFISLAIFYGSWPYWAGVFYSTRHLTPAVSGLSLGLASFIHNHRYRKEVRVFLIVASGFSLGITVQHLLGMRYYPHQDLILHYIRYAVDKGAYGFVQDLLFRLVRYTNLRLLF